MVSFKCLFTTKVLVCYFSRNMQTGAKKLYNSIYSDKESFLSLSSSSVAGTGAASPSSVDLL